MLTWNRERKKTRDRLLDYELPPNPTSSCPLPVYPWTNLSAQMQSYLLDDARQYGFTGSIDDLWALLLQECVQIGTLSTFPSIGETGILYLDTNTNIIYTYKTLNENDLRVDFAKVGYATLGRTLRDNYQIIRALGLAE